MENPDLKASMALLNTATNGLQAGVTAVATALDGASTRIFAVTQTLSTRMTDAEVAAARQTLDTETNRIDNANVALAAVAASLGGLAADPADPVPDPIPDPVDPPVTPVP